MIFPMKTKLLACLVAALLSGCATATFTAGRDFNTSYVSSIEKGKTRSSELIGMMGAPYSKTVNSDGSQTWQWFYSNGKSHAQSYMFKMDVQTQMTGKQLIATLRNDIVENFSFTDGPLGGSQMGAGIGR
jgi:outer membrane protein assembly factor BamE (lipoprotein component of BamABCDE complex)